MILVTKGVSRDMPKWLWIFWLPQVMQYLMLPKENLLQVMCMSICHYLCSLYPQVTWYPLRAIATYYSDQQNPNRIYQTMYNKINDSVNKKLLQNMTNVMKELFVISRNTNDEKLISTLKRILNFSDHLH